MSVKDASYLKAHLEAVLDWMYGALWSWRCCCKKQNKTKKNCVHVHVRLKGEFILDPVNYNLMSTSVNMLSKQSRDLKTDVWAPGLNRE